MSKKNTPVFLQNLFIELPRPLKKTFVLVVDGLLILLATWLAFSLRLDSWILPKDSQYWAYYLALLFSLPTFIAFRLYKAIFRYAGQFTIIAIAKSSFFYGIALFITLNLFFKPEEIPRSISIIQPILAFLLVSASRFSARFLLGQVYRNIFAYQKRPKVLIYGAGQSGRQAAYSIRAAETMTVIGFIDDNKILQGGMIDGLKVYGANQLLRLKEVAGVTDVLLALPSIRRSRRSEILAELSRHHVHVRSVPNLADFADGTLHLSDLREVDIDDLLGRDVALALDTNDALHEGKVVLVSGAGGSIGSELCRQIILLRPEKLVLLDHSEFNLYAIEQELSDLIKQKDLKINIVPKLASVLDQKNLFDILKLEKVQIIYHAAAYKHVPLVESNIATSINNNVWGTLHLAKIAHELEVEKFILISTDKAVRPTNVMGASKRIAEMILQALADRSSRTCFSMVRFGNVLGSSGSVIPLFRKQIQDGGPITLTDPEVTRYFMTIPEAAQLVLQAARMSQGGEVFILDMGKPVKILDLAKKLIELSGLSLRDEENLHGDIEIQVTGLRPGEKLYEELLIGDNPEPTNHSRIMMAKESYVSWGQLEILLTELNNVLLANDHMIIKKQLSRIVIGYNASV
ncbi:polysaccharide biosynthesis protein [Polynucleobacter victoriensis]|uniref:NDP-sugar epimerase, includes UDP-GlcNAc-inverting 4,6-dehydratase FlaA1 and capsular polysaccharide biosynthesis protein EpsC n=1 Tax=Polynucleobacter victoriensis TaxID=2049319 RepID=A0A212T8J8_9BURK|nr:nucleoside-diphosphate sugar epimerase/dehydratase [Polynucleobacter victoriensis]SNC62124.1 NDP-sugar epimerase, includes UDP-GlcNAc-inverting 4,6-dehydratase FlaA1 and capsular polysaccharide biosynthesis protein EpsC [Polynucleobacter victoriensis]